MHAKRACHLIFSSPTLRGTKNAFACRLNSNAPRGTPLQHTQPCSLFGESINDCTRALREASRCFHHKRSNSIMYGAGKSGSAHAILSAFLLLVVLQPHMHRLMQRTCCTSHIYEYLVAIAINKLQVCSMGIALSSSCMALLKGHPLF